MTLVKKTAYSLASAFALLTLVAGFAAAPVHVDGASLAGSAAWAKNGADDPAGHDAGDDRGRNSGRGGGQDDGPSHQ